MSCDVGIWTDFTTETCDPGRLDPMLLAARKPTSWLEGACAGYGRHLLRRAFARVWVGGASALAEDGPTIAFGNHSAWWDPVLAFHLSHDVFRRDQYGLMQGGQLARYPFFRLIGAFGATTDGLDDVRAVVGHAAALLRGEHGGRRRSGRRLLWIYPQGRLLGAHAPVAFRSGLARLARAVPEARLVPVAIRYLFREEQRPEAFVRIGDDVRAATMTHAGREPAILLTRRLEQRLRVELATLDAELAAAAAGDGPAGYRVVLEGRGSLHRFYDRTIGRWSEREQGAQVGETRRRG